jgi:membrane fusion protein, multidrug efflux system
MRPTIPIGDERTSRKLGASRRMLASVLLGVALLGCPATEGAQETPGADRTAPVTPKAKATRVEVATIRPSAAQLVLSLPGEVEASRDAQLSASLGGFVEKVSVKAGEKVKKGQILALIDTASHGARVAQAKVEVDTAKRELERQKLLGKAVAQAAIDAAESRYEAAKAAYRSANVSLDRSVIKAPFAGVMAKVDVEVGETAAPGVPLMRVIQLDPVKVTVSLSDRDVLSVRQGMAAMIGTDARGTLIEGKVALVRPAADVNTRAFAAEIEIDNAEQRLLPGMIANVQVKSDGAGEELVISQDWLVTKPDELGVYVHADGVAKWRPVKIGPIVRDRVVLLEGLAKGDELIISGHRELADGDPLLVARRGVCCVDGRVDFGGGAAKAPPAAETPSSPEKTQPAAQREE